MPPNDRALRGYFALTFAWSWLFFSIATPALRAHGIENAPWWALAALLAGGYGPTLQALLASLRSGGRPAVAELLRGFIRWRGATRVHLAAFLLLPLLSLLGAALWTLFGGGSIGLDASRGYLIPIALVAALPFGPLGEELGWRGYAQPRLLERWSPLATGVLLGTAWTAWHIPLFFAPAGTSISGQPVTVGSVAFYWSLLIGLSILIVWLSLGRGTHLLTGLLVHLAFNAEIYRFLISVPEGGVEAIERWTLAPVWGLIAFLAATGRLGPLTLRLGDRAPRSR